MNVHWKVDSGETNLWQAKSPSEIYETSRLSYYRNNNNKAQQCSICELWLMRVVQTMDMT